MLHNNILFNLFINKLVDCNKFLFLIIFVKSKKLFSIIII